jgi:glycine cleavage system transcriptional repressor
MLSYQMRRLKNSADSFDFVDEMRGDLVKPLLAVSAIGKDRPGIVAGLMRVLLEKGGHLADSNMTRLKGDFAILLLVSLSEGADPSSICMALEKEANTLGLSLLVRVMGEDEKGDDDADVGRTHTLVMFGADKPDWVYRVVETVSRHGLNITALRSQSTGTEANPVYSLRMELDVPSTQAAEGFREALDHLKKELKVDLTFSSSQTGALDGM